MPTNKNQANTSHNFSQITIWLDHELYDKAKHDELATLFVELRWLLQRCKSSPLFNDSDYNQQLQFIIDDVQDWIIKIEKEKKLAKLSPEQVRQIENIGITEPRYHKEKKKRPFVAFLASRATEEWINDYRAIYLLLCFALVQLEKHDHRSIATLNNLRFLNDKSRKVVLPFLPRLNQYNNFSLLQYDFENVEKEESHEFYIYWQKYDEQLAQDFITRIRNRKVPAGANQRIDTQQASDADLFNFKIKEEIHEFYLPVKDFIKQQSGIVKQKKQIAHIIEPQLIENASFTDDITGDVVQPLVTINENIVDEITNHSEINEPQQESQEAYNEITPKKRISPAVDIVKAELQSNAMRKRSLRLYTDPQVASEYEIRTLIEELYAVLSQINIDYSHSDESCEHNENLTLSKNEQICIFLLAVLLSGSTQIFKTETWWQNAYYFAKYEFEFTPARAVLDDRFTQTLSQKNESKLNLFFPEKVSTLLYVFANNFENGFDDKDLSNIQSETKEFFRKINRVHQTRLTFNKVLDYLKVILSRQGEDNAIVDIIRMQPIHQTAALSYINASQMNVIYSHENFYKKLQDLAGVKVEAVNLSIHDHQNLALVDVLALPKDREFYRDDTEPQMGTALLLNENKLRDNCIIPLKDKIIGLFKITDTTHEQFVERHNLFMDYLYILMGLSSGYRPVIETFGRLEDIDINTSVYFISDKENRTSSDIGRFIYLPKIAILQIKHYIDYMRQYSQFYYRKHQIVAQEFDAVLNSQRGIILYLTVQNGQIIAEPFKNDPWITKRLSKYASLPLNWYRHHIRSLKDVGMSLYGQAFNDTDHFTPDIIGYWMGHTDELGYDYYDITSGLKRSKLRKLADLINTKLTEYGFETIDMCQWINLDKE